jgi:hypothetical protein
MKPNKPKEQPFLAGLKTLYHLPVRNDEFSPVRALVLGFLAASFYGFVFYWLTLFIDGTKDSALTIGIIGFISGFLLSLIFDRWKVGFALGELIEPTIQMAVFMIAWALIG